MPAPADDSVFINSRTAKSWATPPQSGTYFLKSVDGDISWVAMTAVPVVVDVQATGSALQQKTTTVYVEKEVVGAYSDIIAISDCD
ncbi:MAG: hypothetical protein B6242_08675 [Anaerolineaceae bacterium 4572_78]|nr:MAG: hypothetical protein B6242_08675 [Anaerolineaceae bacterium 4572_78]